MDQSREALKRAPIPTISPQEVVDFTDSLFQEVHPTLVDQLPPPHLASLQCSFRYLDQSFSELSERLEDNQQSHSDTLKETTAAQALCQEANLVTLERTNNTDSLKIRDEVSHVKVISQNIQRNINELTASLHPSSRILHQLQAAATGLADQQTTFTKNMEYYMYKIGIKFDTHPLLQGTVQKTTGATPPIPLPPNHWPTRSLDDRQKIIQLEADILKKDQELRLKICANTALETAVSDLEEDLCNARSRTEALHSDLSTLRQANLDLRKVQTDSLQAMSRPEDHPAHLSKVQANIQAGQARQMSAFLQREAARLIGENKHTYELAKRGFQEEVSRLREEIRDLKTKMSSHIPDEPAHRSPAYSTQIRSLKLQVTELNKKLEAAMVVNQQLQQTKASPTDLMVQELQSQVDQLSSQIQAAQATHLSEMENLRTTHTTQSITLREEIVTLQAECRREQEHTQAIHTDLEEKITSLRKTDLHAAHTAQHRIAHAECLPAAASSSLQAEITEHLLTIADLQAELQTAKFSMDDFSITASQMERDLTNVEKKYDSTRTELSTIKIELFEATETVTRLSTELKDTAEDLRYQTSLVESSFRENKSIYTQHRDQRATVQELRMALKEAQDKLTKDHSHTTSTACQTTLDLATLMESVQLSPVQLPPLDIPPSSSSPGTVGSQPKAPVQCLLPMASSVLKAASLHQTAQVQNMASSIPQASSSPRAAQGQNIPSLVPQPSPTVSPGAAASVHPATTVPEHMASSTVSKTIPSISRQGSSVTGPKEPAVPTQTNKSPSTANDYIWSPPSEVYELKNKPPETPWAYFIGDSMFKYINPASIVSGGMISRKFHPHAEAVAWELNHLAPQLPKYNKYSDDGPGLDILIISVGTNDVSRVQKMGGIASHVDADKLMQSRIAQWPNHIIDLYKGATACLDKYGKAFVILPIGTNHIANEVSGISHFRHLAIQYAKQFPRVCLVTNSNMMRQDRALVTHDCPG